MSLLPSQGLGLGFRVEGLGLAAVASSHQDRAVIWRGVGWGAIGVRAVVTGLPPGPGAVLVGCPTGKGSQEACQPSHVLLQTGLSVWGTGQLQATCIALDRGPRLPLEMIRALWVQPAVAMGLRTAWTAVRSPHHFCAPVPAWSAGCSVWAWRALGGTRYWNTSSLVFQYPVALLSSCVPVALLLHPHRTQRAACYTHKPNRPAAFFSHFALLSITRQG